jgi:hypothetical protein
MITPELNGVPRWTSVFLLPTVPIDGIISDLNGVAYRGDTPIGTIGSRRFVDGTSVASVLDPGENAPEMIATRR